MHDIVLDRLRAMTVDERARLLDDLYRDAVAMVTAGVRAQHGDLTPDRERFLVLERMYGSAHAEVVFGLRSIEDLNAP